MKKALIFLFLLRGAISLAQIGIGTTSPHTSSILDVKSTNKGFLPPRMTTLERDVINSGTFAEGLIIYNTDEKCINFYNSTSWINACTGSVSTPAPVPPPDLPGSIVLTPGQTTYLVSIYDNDYVPYTEPTAVASTGTAVADGTNEILINEQGVLNTTTGLKVKIPYMVTTGTVSLPAFSQIRTVIADHIQGANALSNDGGGTPVDVEFSYDAATLNVGSGTIEATIKAVANPLNAIKLDINSGLGTDIGILMAEFSIAINDAGDTGPVYLRDIPGVPDRNIIDADHKFLYIPILAADGNLWLNNNLGANYANLNHAQFNPAQQATAHTDYHAYGSLYQWGRYSDGHELINYSSETHGIAVTVTTSITQSTTVTPNNTTFYIGDPYGIAQVENWLDLGYSLRATEDNLWQGKSGINNPCPQGFRLPTEVEMTALISAEGITSNITAASSSLAFTFSGRRHWENGSLRSEGRVGYYWSSTLKRNTARSVTFYSSYTSTSSRGRAIGLGVRCLKHTPTQAENILTQIGNEADSPDAVNSVVTIVQLNAITPALTGVDPTKEAVYQDYIDANPNLFSGPATQAEVQAMITSLITPPNLPANIILTPGQTQYIVSIYDNDYFPYTESTAVAATGTAVADGTNETIINVQGVLNTTTGLKVKIPYTVSSGSVVLPAFNQIRTVIADHIQGAIPFSNNGGGTPVDVEFSYPTATLSGSGAIEATIKAVTNPLNAVKLDVNAGIGTDFGILLAEFSIALNDVGDTGPVYLKDITAAPDRNSNDANHKFIYIPVLAADGNLWLNNNLGANYANLNHAQFNPPQQATAYNDFHAYGSLYQWGRFSDGHELINYSSGTVGTPVTTTTSLTPSATITPNNSTFYLGDDSPTTQDYNWLDFGISPNALEDNLWQGEAGINNPCPQGFRLPTEVEMTTLIFAEGINDNSSAISSSLALPTSGYQNYSDGMVYGESTHGYYWSSTVNGAYSRCLFFNSSMALTFSSDRAYGFGVRCIKD